MRRTLESSSVTRARWLNRDAARSPGFFQPYSLVWFGAYLLLRSQLVGAAGPGGGLVPPGPLVRNLVPAFGFGALTSGICSIRLRSGGTVRLLTTECISFLCSIVARGACSRRKCAMRWFTVCGSDGAEDAVARELCRDG
jgi:hypothetical protein